MIIVGDIGGQFYTLMKLVEKFPKGEDIIFVGDLVDRGGYSKDVISWVMANAKESLMGNHEHMMLDFFNDTEIYGDGIWHMNGGSWTKKAYFSPKMTDFHHKEYVWDQEGGDYTLQKVYYDPILKEHLEWLSKRPLDYQTDKVFVSHAPFSPYAKDPYDITRLDDSIIWNREDPSITSKLQVYGHNGIWNRHVDPCGKTYAMCIDNSRRGSMMALNTETMEIYEQKFELTL